MSWRDWCAGGAGVLAGWCTQDIGGERAYPVGEPDLGPEPEHPGGPLRRGHHVPDVPGSGTAHDYRRRTTHRGRQGPRQVAHRARGARADIHRHKPIRGYVSGQRQHVRLCDVRDVDEVPALLTVLHDPGRLPAFQRRAEERRHSGVRGVPGHPGAVDVVVPQRPDAASGLAYPGRRQVLLGYFRCGVGTSWFQGRVFGHQSGSQRGCALRAGRIIATGLDVFGMPGRRPRWTVPLAGVPALAVDHHRAGQHQAGHPARVHRRQQDRRRVVVVPGVPRGIGRVGAVPDHGRLVAHCVHPGQQPGQQRRVGHVPDHELVPGAPRRRPVPVRLRQQLVQQQHLVPLVGQRVGDV